MMIKESPFLDKYVIIEMKKRLIARLNRSVDFENAMVKYIRFEMIEKCEKCPMLGIFHFISWLNMSIHRIRPWRNETSQDGQETFGL